MHKKPPQSTVTSAPLSNKSNEDKPSCKCTSATVVWGPLSFAPLTLTHTHIHTHTHTHTHAHFVNPWCVHDEEAISSGFRLPDNLFWLKSSFCKYLNEASALGIGDDNLRRMSRKIATAAILNCSHIAFFWQNGAADAHFAFFLCFLFCISLLCWSLCFLGGGGRIQCFLYFLAIAVGCASFFGHGGHARQQQKGDFVPTPSTPRKSDTFQIIYICCKVKNWSKIWGFIS